MSISPSSEPFPLLAAAPLPSMIIEAIFFCAIDIFSTSARLIGGGSSAMPASSFSVNSIVEATWKSCQSISAKAIRSASALSSSSFRRLDSHFSHSTRSRASLRTSRRPAAIGSPRASFAACPALRSTRARNSFDGTRILVYCSTSL